MSVLMATIAVSSMTLGQVVMVDSFGSYPLGSISEQGNWQAQRNSTILGDHGYSNVVIQDGDRALQIINRDFLGEVDTVFTAMELPTAISTGTIYLRWMKSSEGFSNYDGTPPDETYPGTAPVSPVFGDVVFATNGEPAGWVEDSLLPGEIDNMHQRIANYSDQASLVYLRADDDGYTFRARNNGYQDSTSHVDYNTEDQWHEMCIQQDYPNQQTRYYIAEDGEAATVVLNGTGGEWWAHRNASNSQTSSIKIFAGLAWPGQGWPPQGDPA